MPLRYIGIDVHTSSCTIAVMGPTGKRLRHWQVETERRVLVEAIRSVPGPRHICFEEGTLSDWVYELLEPVAEELQVIQPPRTRGVKSDTHDAWVAANTMRLQPDDVTRVFKSPGTFTALRKAVRTHGLIQRDMVRAKNRIHACYRARGVQGLSSSIYDPLQRNEWLKKLPRPQRRMTELLCSELDGLVETCHQATLWMREEAQRVPAVALISTAPGISAIRASQVVATVVSPHRFRTSRQFWAYCGLAIVTRSSSDWTREQERWVRTNLHQTRGLNRNHQPVLKNVFKGAAKTISNTRMAAHPLHQSYQRLLASGTKPNLAQLTIARRIAAAVLAMWKNKETYDPTKQAQAA